MIAPCQFVIFGATGDLSINKLLPALYHLDVAGRLPDNMAIVAVSRREYDVGQWREFLWQELPARLGEEYREAAFQQFLARFGYVRVVTPPAGADGSSIQALRIDTLGLWLDIDRRTAEGQGSGAGIGWRQDERVFAPMDIHDPNDCRFVLRVANDTQFEAARRLIEMNSEWRGGCVIGGRG